MRRSVLATTAFLAMAISLSALGIRAAQQQPRPADPAKATGVVAGRVIEVGTNRPVDEAVVTLSGGPGVGRRMMVDGQGRFIFQNLPAGSYDLDASQFGYVQGGYRKTQPDSYLSELKLAEGQRIMDADLLMWRFASITGRVVDETGEPIARVAVRAIQSGIEGDHVTIAPVPIAAAMTDDRGVYRLAKLIPGEYGVAVAARVSTFPVSAVRSANAGGPSLGVTETASLGDWRYLQIGDNVLASISSAPIPPAPLPGGQLTVFQTTYYPAAVSPDEAELMKLAPGEERAGIDIRLVPVPAVNVSGTITGPAGPVPNAAFRVVRTGGSRVTETNDFEAATGITGPDGRFTLLGIPKGRYEIRMPVESMSSLGWKSTDRILTTREPVTVGDVAVSNVNVIAHNAPTLIAAIKPRSGVRADPNHVRVIVHSVDLGPQRVASPTADKEFAFSSRILPGRYLMTAYVESERCPVVSVGGRDVGDALVTVEFADVNVAFDCNVTTAKLIVRARDDARNPDARARVVVFPTDRRQWQGDDYRPLRFASVPTRAEAPATVAGLLAGEYFVASVPDTLGEMWRKPSNLEQLAKVAARITLQSGDTKTTDIVTVTLK